MKGRDSQNRLQVDIFSRGDRGKVVDKGQLLEKGQMPNKEHLHHLLRLKIYY